MQHPDEGTIHAWLDGALPAAEASAIEAHVSSCAECEARVAEARGLIAASSRIVEHLDVIPGKVIPAAAPVKMKSWLRSPWPAAIAAMLIIGIGFVASRDHVIPSAPVIPSASEGPAFPKLDTQPSLRPNAAVAEKQIPRSARDDKLELPPPRATVQRNSATATAPSPAPRRLDAERKAAASQQRAEDRLAEATVSSANTARSLAKTSAGAAAAGRAPTVAAAPSAAIGTFAAADQAADSAFFTGCYELVRSPTAGVETRAASPFNLPGRFALVSEPAPALKLLGIRRLDADGNRAELLEELGWRIERGRAIVIDQDGRMVMTISKSDSGALNASPAVRILSCK